MVPNNLLGIPKEVLACRNFDEVLSKHYFEKLSEAQQIIIYNHFTLQESEREKAISYSDLEDCSYNFSIHVDGADTCVKELLDEGYSIRQCKEKGKELRGLAAWLDERDWKYLGVIYVAPRFRGNGIMGALIEDGRENKPIRTMVHRGNFPAVKAFRKYGFEVEQRDSSYIHFSRR